MRAVAIAAGLLLASACASAQPAMQARPQFKWCHVQPPYYEYFCVFRSIEECRLEIPGLGGYCNLNPRYVEPPAKPKRPARRRSGAR